MSDQLSDTYIKRLSEVNSNYKGNLSSATFIVEQGGKSRKIFKWLFKPENIDFYVAFPYYKCKEFHCGAIKMQPGEIRKERFDAVEHGIASKIPVKFSYHKDGKVHFKPTNNDMSKDKSFKLAEMQAIPITQLSGDHIFTINFEGLARFDELKHHRKKPDELEIVLPVPDDILNFQIIAYAGTSEEQLNGKLDESSPPWFVVSGKLAGIPVFIGIYARLSRKSLILDNNKSCLTAFVGFDKAQSILEEEIKSLYLFAR